MTLQLAYKRFLKIALAASFSTPNLAMQQQAPPVYTPIFIPVYYPPRPINTQSTPIAISYNSCHPSLSLTDFIKVITTIFLIGKAAEYTSKLGIKVLEQRYKKETDYLKTSQQGIPQELLQQKKETLAYLKKINFFFKHGTPWVITLLSGIFGLSACAKWQDLNPKLYKVLELSREEQVKQFVDAGYLSFLSSGCCLASFIWSIMIDDHSYQI